MPIDANTVVTCRECGQANPKAWAWLRIDHHSVVVEAVCDECHATPEPMQVYGPSPLRAAYETFRRLQWANDMIERLRDG